MPLMPSDWGFFHDDMIVENGFIMWANTDFRQMPTLEEAANHQPTWVNDLHLRRRLQKRMDEFVNSGTEK